MKLSIYIFPLLLLAALPAFAQNDSDSLTFQGRVVNLQGIPLKDAVIKGTNTNISFTTGTDGSFYITLPKEGDIMVTSKEGLSSFSFLVDYNYKGVIALNEQGGAWMSYGEYLKQMAGTARTYFDAGMKYYKGETDGTPDYKKAFACFWRAANMEHEPSKYYLGKMYDEGIGLPQNYDNAIYWYKEASRSKEAVLRLGAMYAEGIGVQQDDKQAAQYYHTAVGMGDSIVALKLLNEILEKGQVKKEDLVDDDIKDIVDTNAQFPGGDSNCYRWIAQHLKYPAIAQEQGIQGTVFVRFVVDKDGTIMDVEVKSSPDASLSKEAIRVIGLMPQWKPAMQRNKVVRSRFHLPIKFSLGGGKPQQSKPATTQPKAAKPAPPSDSDHIYELVETNAQFPGGDDACYQFLAKNLKYPAKAQKEGIQGRAFVRFVVNKDGSISDIECTRSPDPSLAEEAVRVVSLMPKWTPATQGGKSVRSRFNLPIMFKLTADESN